MNNPTPRDSAQLPPAPPHSLPTHDECALRVANSDFIAKRVTEGGYGQEADSKLATELHRFIYEYDDADPYRSAWFLHRLELLLEETKREALRAQAASPRNTEFGREAEKLADDYLELNRKYTELLSAQAASVEPVGEINVLDANGRRHEPYPLIKWRDGFEPKDGAKLYASAPPAHIPADVEAHRNFVLQAQALIDLDAEGALVPHGIGGHARTLLKDAIRFLSKDHDDAELAIDPNPSSAGQQRQLDGSMALGQPVGDGADQGASNSDAERAVLLNQPQAVVASSQTQGDVWNGAVASPEPATAVDAVSGQMLHEHYFLALYPHLDRFRGLDVWGELDQQEKAAWNRAALQASRQPVTQQAVAGGAGDLLERVRPYVAKAYECAFPDADENQAVLRDIDAALATKEQRNG